MIENKRLMFNELKLLNEIKQLQIDYKHSSKTFVLN
jgi:hypothetical protein